MRILQTNLKVFSYAFIVSNILLNPQVIMPHRDILAPREDGSIAQVRVYDDFTPPLGVDCDRAYRAVGALGKYKPSYRWSTQLFTFLASAILVGGFVSLFWWPWWVPIIGVVVSRIIYKSAKQSCADFVREIIRDNATGANAMAQLGLIVSKIPANAVTTR